GPPSQHRERHGAARIPHRQPARHPLRADRPRRLPPARYAGHGVPDDRPQRRVAGPADPGGRGLGRRAAITMTTAGRKDTLDAAVERWFEQLDDRGVFMTDDRLIVRRWNRWLAAQTGRREEEVVGRPLLDVYPALVDRGVDRCYREALAGEV